MTDETSNAIKLQAPSTVVKPHVTVQQAIGVVWRVYGLKINVLKDLPSYDDLNFYFRADEEYDNGHIPNIAKDGYVLKIFNRLQSSNPTSIDAIHALMNYVTERGVATQSIVHNRKGMDYSLETFKDEIDGEVQQYAVRIVTFVPGIIFDQSPLVAESIRNVGEFVGMFQKAIEGFHHPFYDTYSNIWNLVETPAIRNFVQAVKDKQDRQMVDDVIGEFEKYVASEFINFKKGMIHGDINAQNLIVHKVPVKESEADTGVHDVTAILDFTDAVYSYTVFEIATSITYLSIESPDESQLDVGGHFLAGYYKHSSLNKSEMKCIRTVMCARLCQTLVLGAHSINQQPDNEYVLLTSKRGWSLLRKLWNTSDNELYCRWNDILKSYGQ